MTLLPVNKFYFRWKGWQKVVPPPRLAMALKERNPESRALPHSGPEGYSKFLVIDELEAESTYQ